MTKIEINRIKVALAETRRKNKWLAEQLGKDQAMVSKWCTNTTQPSLEMLMKIAQALGIEAKNLLREQSNI